MKDELQVSSKQPSILIVDDNTRNLQVVGSTLRENNYRISVATNGLKALEIAFHTVPDLILLDIMMPVMDGFTVCQKLKENPKTVEIPVIFLTAKTDVDSIVKGFKIGAVDYITKPFKTEELLARVHTHVELKLARETIERQTLELRKANEAKDRLFSIIGHDLRGPLGNIRSMLGIFESRSKMDESQYMRFIQLAKDSVTSSYSLLENLLQWARSQKNEINRKPEKLDLVSTIDENIFFNSNIAKSKNISIQCLLQPPLWIMADKNMLTTILRNLITNAIKYTHEEGYIHIDAKPDANNRHIIISIKDSGVGMTAQQLATIFNKDEYTTTFGTKSEKGSGLGLKLCLDFVEAHGCQIWAESTLNNGSTFLFTMPMA